jgi:hypothetical protein
MVLALRRAVMTLPVKQHPKHLKRWKMTVHSITHCYQYDMNVTRWWRCWLPYSRRTEHFQDLSQTEQPK